MADAPPATSSTGNGLTRKVGPLPVWAWAALGFAAYWLYTKFSSGASSTATPAAGTGTPGSLSIGNITQRLRGGSAAAGKTTTTTTKPGKTPAPGKQTSITTTKPESLLTLARSLGMSESQVIFLNPGLIKYDTPKGIIPKGTKVITGPKPTQQLPGLPSPGTGKLPPNWPKATTPPPTVKPKPGTSRTTTAGGQGSGGGTQNITIDTGQPQTQVPGGPVSPDTGQPVFWEWEHTHRGPEVPEPVEAFAPQTNGAVMASQNGAVNGTTAATGLAQVAGG